MARASLLVAAVCTCCLSLVAHRSLADLTARQSKRLSDFEVDRHSPSDVGGSGLGSLTFDEETGSFPVHGTDDMDEYASSGDEEVTVVSPMIASSSASTVERFDEDSRTTVFPDVISLSSTASPSSSLLSFIDEPPRLRDRLAKVSLEVGAAFSMLVPDTMFGDREDGGTHQLRLQLTADDQELSSRHWLQLNSADHRIYALPKEEDVGEYKFQLSAFDSSEQRATDTLYVSVRQFRQWRTVNHHLILYVNFNDAKAFPIDIDWQLLLMTRIENMLSPNVSRRRSESMSNSVSLYRVDRSLPGQPVQVTWFNRSLSTRHCDLPALRRIVSRLRDENGSPSSELRAVLSPEFVVKRVSVKLLQLCSGSKLDPAEHDSYNDPVIYPESSNSVPYRRHPLDLIEAHAGRLLQLQIPSDTFHDREDGDTRRLQVHLLGGDRSHLPPDHWLRFEPNNQEFIGVPLSHDIGIYHYHLECIDSGGLSVTDSIEVHVKPDVELASRPSVVFSVTLAAAFDRFIADSMQRALLVQRLSRLFDEVGSDRSVVVVTAVRRDTMVHRGAAVVEWRNASLSGARCGGEVALLRSRLLDDAGQVSAAARSVLAPHFSLLDASVVPHGACLADPSPTLSPPAVMPSSLPPPGATPTLQWRVSAYLITFVAPGLVIVLLLLVAGLAAGLLLRVKRRRIKLSSQREAADYVSRGVPVIFADELPMTSAGQCRRASHQSGALDAWRRRRSSGLLVDGPNAPMLDTHYDEERSVMQPMTSAGSTQASSSPFIDRQPPPYTPIT